MIITQLNGGLGNQLFQYAAGKALAEYHQTNLKFDLSLLRAYKTYKYELDVFSIKASIAETKDIKTFAGLTSSVYLNKVLFQLRRKKLLRYPRFYYREPYFHYDNNFFQLPDNSYIEGYWQSEKYFSNIANVVQKELKLKKELSSYSKKILEKINSSKSVSLHIRRGDYITDTKANRVHGVCSLDYYKRAIEKAREIVGGDVIFFVFSNDIEWTKNSLPIQATVSFVKNPQEGFPYEDMYLMSQCQHHIIANSSFSWWGAWLNSSNDKLVIAPKQWFKDKSLNSKDLISSCWVEM